METTMQPSGERKVNAQQKQQTGLFDRMQFVADKNREVYEEAMQDFRNRFTLGETRFGTSDDSER